MKKYIFLFFLGIGNAYATIETGNSFLESINKVTKRQHLLSYTAGLYDAYERIDPSIFNCLGENIRMSQLVDSIGIYLKNNPQVRHYAMYDIYPIAVKNMFNCK